MTNEAPPKKRKWIKTLVFILFNIAIIGWTAYREYASEAEVASLADVRLDFRFLLPAAACFIFAVFCEICIYVMLMKRTIGWSSWNIARRTVLIGRYYDNITPAAIGGQPFQIYQMSRSGIPAAQSAVIPIASFMSIQIGFILVALSVFLFFGLPVDIGVGNIACYIGLSFYAFFPTAIIVSMFFPKAITRAGSLLVNLAHKLRIVKNADSKIIALEETVIEYARSIRGLLSTPHIIIGGILLALGYQIALNSVPYFVLTAFGGDIPYSECFSTIVMINAAIAFIPTPGNAGIAEGSFYLVFSSLTEGLVFWAMLVWRFFSFYLFIILGLIIHFENNLIDRKKNDPPKDIPTEGGTK